MDGALVKPHYTLVFKDSKLTVFMDASWCSEIETLCFLSYQTILTFYPCHNRMDGLPHVVHNHGIILKTQLSYLPPIIVFEANRKQRQKPCKNCSFVKALLISCASWACSSGFSMLELNPALKAVMVRTCNLRERIKEGNRDRVRES